MLPDGDKPLANAKRKQKLTKTVIEGLIPEQNEYRVWDSLVPAFYVRVFPSGSKKYYVFYRTARGQARNRTVGAFLTMTIERARDQARKHIAAAKDGKDPHGDQDSLRSIPTLAGHWETYWRDHASIKKSARSADSDMTLWTKHLCPTFGAMFIDKIEPAGIMRWHAKLADTPGAANRALSLLSKLMSLAEVGGYRPSNPCKGIEKYPETPRDPSVSDEELSLLWKAAEREQRTGDKGAARVVMLILLTGARRGEVLKAAWSEFDLTSDLPVWRVPVEHIKGGRRRVILISRNLSSSFAATLSRWKAEACGTSGLLFPSSRGGASTRFDINKPWARIRMEAGRPDLRLHDLRHVFATVAIGEGHSLAEIGETLGHRCTMTTRRYAHIEARQKSRVANTVSEKMLSFAEA